MNIKNWKLKHKIILHLIVIGLLSASLLTFLYIRTQRNIINTMSRQKAELVGSLVENTIFTAMKEAKFENVQKTLHDIAFSRDIQKIRILSPQGRVLRSSSREEIGSSIDASTLQKLKSFLSKTDKRDTVFIRPRSTLLSFHTIQNRPQCFECHSSDQKINGVLELNIEYAAAADLLKKSQIQGILLGLAALGILIYVILRLFDKLINQPISRLKDKMKDVQEGNLDIEFPHAKNDEIGSLTKSFTVMVKNLKKANQKIEELFNKQMEKAEHLASLGELAAGLAHDIRNPIAGMKGALEIISQKTDPSDPKKEIFAEILLQIEKIYSIIQDLLSYAKPKRMNMKPVSPNDCVQTAIKLANPQLNGKNIQFSFKGLESETLACLDADKIQEVLLNLILNSISAIKDEGHISIELQITNTNDLKIIFSDDGSGIKPEHLSHVFNPFFTTKKGGTGLGLSICWKIVEAHGGRIDVESRAGMGTTFVIHLPMKKNHSNLDYS